MKSVFCGELFLGWLRRARGREEASPGGEEASKALGADLAVASAAGAAERRVAQVLVGALEAPGPNLGIAAAADATRLPEAVDLAGHAEGAKLLVADVAHDARLARLGLGTKMT